MTVRVNGKSRAVTRSKTCSLIPQQELSNLPIRCLVTAFPANKRINSIVAQRPRNIKILPSSRKGYAVDLCRQTTHAHRQHPPLGSA